MGDKCFLDLLAYGTDWTVVSFKPKRKQVKVGERGEEGGGGDE